MRNQVFTKWDEVGCEIEEFTLPAVNQGMLDALPATTPPRLILDLIDVWQAEEAKVEIGHERVHLTLSNGTHLMIAEFGDRRKKYAIGWHPTDQDAQKDAMTAVVTGLIGEVDEDDDAGFAALVSEVSQKYAAETTFGG